MIIKEQTSTWRVPHIASILWTLTANLAIALIKGF